MKGGRGKGNGGNMPRSNRLREKKGAYNQAIVRSLVAQAGSRGRGFLSKEVQKSFRGGGGPEERL